MPAPTFTADDFASAERGLLPSGRIWQAEPGTVQYSVLEGLAPTPQRVAARAANLLVDAFPATTIELLPEWELTLGLPDPCAAIQPTIQQRQAQVLARFIGDGGQSVPYFVNFAATLGYAITITQYHSWTFGMPFGMLMCGALWDFVWQVNAPTFTINYFEFGDSGFGQAFSSWSNSVLQCELNRIKPAHTTIIFKYS
jgi:uncharacterized protein YmfQ (DUF2313 family)